MQSIVPPRQNRAKCSYRPLQRAKCSYRTKLDCLRVTTHSHATRLFLPIWTQNVVCTSSDMVAMWLVRIPPSLRSGGYTSHSSQSPPCRPWYTIYYFLGAVKHWEKNFVNPTWIWLGQAKNFLIRVTKFLVDLTKIFVWCNPRPLFGYDLVKPNKYFNCFY